jgi:hypothetical protein
MSASTASTASTTRPTYSVTQTLILTAVKLCSTIRNSEQICTTHLHQSFIFLRATLHSTKLITCHPYEHKMASTNYVMNRVHTYPVTNEEETLELNIIQDTHGLPTKM